MHVHTTCCQERTFSLFSSLRRCLIVLVEPLYQPLEIGRLSRNLAPETVPQKRGKVLLTGCQ